MNSGRNEEPEGAQTRPNTLLHVKRRVGYETTGTDEEEGGARDKRRHMDVDDATAPLVQGFSTHM